MAEPIVELVALYFERQATGWLVSSEQMESLKKEHYGLDIADVLMYRAAETRLGNTALALKALCCDAVNSEEARELMLALDPTAWPVYPNPDQNGDSVVVGRTYWWQLDLDNQGNVPGYYYEGIVTDVQLNWALAYWLPVGHINQVYRDSCVGYYGPLRPTRAFTELLLPVD